MEFKNLKRYRKWLLIWVTFYVLFNLILVVNIGISGSFNIYVILTQNFWIDTILIFSMIPIFSVLAYFIGGYVFTPLLIYLHKKIIGRHLKYGIKQREKPTQFKGAFIKSIFPALMAFNFAILLSDNPIIHDILFTSAFKSGAPPAVLQILTITILLPIVSAIGIASFSAAFFLIDSGIEYTNKEQKKVINGSYPVEVRSLGAYYLYFLKGYAGISVIISIIQLLSDYLTSIQDIGSAIYIINLITWPFMPFAIALFMVPVVIIQDATYTRRNLFVKRWAEKFEITGKLENPLGREQK